MKARVLHVFRSLDHSGILDIGFESSAGPFDFPAGNFHVDIAEANRLADALSAQIVGADAKMACKNRKGSPIFITNLGPDSGLTVEIDDPQEESLSWTISDSEARKLIGLIRNENCA